MLNEGTILDDRYEVIHRIGTGGMSDVYKAMDNKLNRYVAIKVLKQEFSENRGFVSKFRVEAQSAAILTHPNIVNVYDVGSQDGLHYIVMELVEGVTLKRYIEKKVRLSVNETISIAIQVSMGIENAHNNHIIHRDIKPQNIIISKDGKVKVTDFGIARAATSDTVTSNAMGSVHYTSPEQARGGYSDEKSDIYSLGITMFEMITGRVPFDGDTTVSIAIAHIQEELPSPKLYAMDIPISLEQIIIKCCQKRPDRRYQSMAELVADLKKALLNPDGDFVVVIPEERNEAKTKMISENERNDIRQQTGGIADPEIIAKATKQQLIEDEDERSSAINIDDEMFNNYKRPVKKRPAAEFADDYSLDAEELKPKRLERKRNEENETPIKRKKRRVDAEEREERPRRKRPVDDGRRRVRENERPRDIERRRPPKKSRGSLAEYDYEEDLDPKMDRIMSVLGIIAAIIIVIIAVFVVTKVFDIFKSTTSVTEEKDKTVVMEEVVGENFDTAKSKLRSLGLEVQATYESSSSVDRNLVMEQSIEAGEKIPEGTLVELIVSSGTDGVLVPDLNGLSEAEAKVALENSGFLMEKDYAASADVEKGNVVSQNPSAGSNAPTGATITVIISQGASTEEVVVPDVRLQTQEDATIMLNEAGLVLGSVTTEVSPTVPVGCVISQSYSPNVTVPAGTSVSIVLSDGGDGAIYRCNLAVAAPADYAGGNADIVLTQNDSGIVLFATTTSSFPVAINLANITGTPQCTLAIRYDVLGTTMIDGEDGNPVPVPITESKTDSQSITLSVQ